MFKVRVDPEEGCAERVCTNCEERAFMLDSHEYVEDATLEPAGCPCGGESFNVAVGFAFREDPSDLKWIYVGLRCVRDSVLGCLRGLEDRLQPLGSSAERRLNETSAQAGDPGGCPQLWAARSCRCPGALAEHDRARALH